MRKALTLVVLFAVASSARGITIQLTGNNGDLMNLIATLTSTQNTGAGVWVDVWDIDMQAIEPINDPDEVWAFDGTIYSDPGAADPNGLYQCKAFDAMPTPTLTNAGYLAAAMQGYDTHFDQLDADLGPARAPSEDVTYSLGVTTAPHSEGWGTYLDGAFTRTAGVQVPFQLAQVVVPMGGKFQIQGEAADGLDTAWTLNHLIPEPATMALLAVGAVALIRRRP